MRAAEEQAGVVVSYLLCYLGAGNALILHSYIEAKSMGAAILRADEEKARDRSRSRWFVLHGYEIEDEKQGSSITDDYK